ncbi:MAG: phosphatase PAP2 family protein [Sandaracinaceae bacterium]|nr:phosphatase PAP2 family protein [Sandaracinaceae bacterium]
MLRSPVEIVKRLIFWVIGLFVIVFFYGLGKLELVATPTELPLTSLDRAIPFVPWTVWLYGTITWTSFVAWLSVRERADAARLMAAITVASAACALVFIVWPTTFPRGLYPLPEGLGARTLAELAELRDDDSPSNCFPSLHVALAWGIALTWASWIRRRPLAVLPIAWALVVSVTTVTTKQHYVVDVPAGMLVGAFAWWAARRIIPTERATPVWMRTGTRLEPRWEAHQARLAKLRETVEAGQWSLDEVDWPEGPLPPLDPTLVRLVNELIYVEEIAGMNFAILARASKSEDLRVLYTCFAEEEKRHADGLRRVLELHEAPLRPPGLGNSMVLDEFDALDPESVGDVFLIATANPVFETMLDAGTVPFLREHPALASPWFDDFVKRITRDESAHLAVNWMVIREAGERYAGLRGLRLLLNPSILRGMIAVPFMSLDVYSLAHRLGYRFETLLPAFGKLWRLHRRYPELRWFPLWWVFRTFTAAGAIATIVTAGLVRAGLLFVRFWTTFTSLTDLVARFAWGRALLAKRGLPLPGRVAS